MCPPPLAGSVVGIPTVTFPATGGIQWQRSRSAAADGTPSVVNPSREFEDIYDRMGQLMNFAFGLTPAVLADMPWVPLADLSETDDAYVVKAELPGVNKDQVNIQLQDRELVISGEVPEPEDEQRQRQPPTAARAAPAGSSCGPTCPVMSTPTPSPRSSPTAS